MQCNSCQFENMPGIDSCCRCGSSMRLATVVMDLAPPRASLTQKRFRKLLPRSQSYFRARDQIVNGSMAARDGVHRVAAELQPATLPPWPLLLRSFVPGWGNFYTGQRVRGWLFLGAFLLTLVPGFLMMGSFWGSVMLGLAFSAHTAAATDVINQNLPREAFREQISRSLLMTVLIAVLMWWPADLLLNRVASVRRIETYSGALAGGDVVRVFSGYRHADWPRVGQVVLYTLPQHRYQLDTGTHTRYLIEMEGERVDRIIAAAGDRVEWNHGVLKVNGKLSTTLPMNALALPQAFHQTVPPGHVMILPSTTPRVSQLKSSEVAELSMIPINQIEGRVWLRSQPFSRIAWID